MRNNLQNDVKIENAKNFASKFNLSGSYSSTASVGEVSVKFSRLLQPNTKAMCGEESLIFLAPLAAPTYAKQHYKTWHNFIPVEDVWPNYSAFITQQSISRNGEIIQPTLEPCVPKDGLSLFTLNGARGTLYLRPLDSTPGDVDDVSDYVSGIYFEIPASIANQTTSETYKAYRGALEGLWAKRANGTPRFDFGKLVGCTLDSGNESTLSLESGNLTRESFLVDDNEYGQSDWNGYELSGRVPMETSDFNLYRYVSSTAAGTQHDYIACFAFRLSSWGIHLFKILKGLGYGIDVDAKGENRSILPLLAAYKAYWDVFGLNLWQNFESTYCGRLISALEQTNDVNVWYNDDIWPIFKSFVYEELGSMWLTEKNDYVSAHLPQPTVSAVNQTPLRGVFDVANPDVKDINNNPLPATPDTHIVQNSFYDGSQRSDQPAIVPAGDGHAYIRQTAHGYLDSEILKRLYKRTNANTALGKKIADLMRSQGLGTYMERTRVNYIGDTDVELNVQSVISTADTFKQAGEGAMLGERGGRGVGYKPNKNKLFYKTDCIGYWICLDCITCDSGYSQAEDTTLQDLTQYQKYQPDYENLGLQLDSKAVVNGSRNEGFGGLISPSSSKRTKLSMSRQPFGFAPRYSHYKVGRSVLSGGFALRSQRRQFSSYNMDKLVLPDEFFNQQLPDEFTIEGYPDFKCHLHMRAMKTSDVPTAGNSWRYLGRFPWMGNLDRIFAAFGKEPSYSLWLTEADYLELAKVWEYHYRREDNYILLGEVWFKAWSHMLPIEETYGTVDNDKKELEYVERV